MIHGMHIACVCDWTLSESKSSGAKDMGHLGAVSVGLHGTCNAFVHAFCQSAGISAIFRRTFWWQFVYAEIIWDLDVVCAQHDSIISSSLCDLCFTEVHRKGGTANLSILGASPRLSYSFQFSDDLYRWVFYYFYHFCHLRWCSIFPLVNPPLWEDFFQVLQQIQVFVFCLCPKDRTPDHAGV